MASLTSYVCILTTSRRIILHILGHYHTCKIVFNVNYPVCILEWDELVKELLGLSTFVSQTQESV